MYYKDQIVFHFTGVKGILINHILQELWLGLLLQYESAVQTLKPCNQETMNLISN